MKAIEEVNTIFNTHVLSPPSEYYIQCYTVSVLHCFSVMVLQCCTITVLQFCGVALLCCCYQNITVTKLQYLQSDISGVYCDTIAQLYVAHREMFVSLFWNLLSIFVSG